MGVQQPELRGNANGSEGCRDSLAATKAGLRLESLVRSKGRRLFSLQMVGDGSGTGDGDGRSGESSFRPFSVIAPAARAKMSPSPMAAHGM